MGGHRFRPDAGEHVPVEHVLAEGPSQRDGGRSGGGGGRPVGL